MDKLNLYTTYYREDESFGEFEDFNLEKMIKRLEARLENIGISELQSSIFNDLNRTDINLGTNSDINTIPANPAAQGYCCRVVLAIAAGTRGRGGISQVMQQLRSHLIQCTNPSNGCSTKLAILIYDKEDKRVFWENKRDFFTQFNVNGVTLVRYFWNGKRLVKQATMQ